MCAYVLIVSVCCCRCGVSVSSRGNGIGVCMGGMSRCDFSGARGSREVTEQAGVRYESVEAGDCDTGGGGGDGVKD